MTNRRITICCLFQIKSKISFETKVNFQNQKGKSRCDTLNDKFIIISKKVLDMKYILDFKGFRSPVYKRHCATFPSGNSKSGKNIIDAKQKMCQLIGSEHLKHVTVLK